jgi:hypothetical protein
MKKFLSLVLALVMTMSLVTVSAGAKDFTDNSKINYKEAVDVLSAVKVIDGYTDGAFNPANTLTRGAAAKIICNLILGPTAASALVADAAPYKDVPANHTFAGYIAYCQKEGIISGYADGTFKPANSLTGYAFMKMLLGALGYDSTIEGYTGNNWSINVAKRALNIGLDDSLIGEFNGVKAVNREEACLYAFNTLKATMVEYDSTTNITVGGAQVVIAGSKAKDMANTGKTDGNIKNDNKMQFAEKYFEDLKGTATTDDFKRPATEWKVKNTKVGKFVNTDDLVATYTKKVTNADMYDLIGSTDADALKDNDTTKAVLAAYVDGQAVANLNSQNYFKKNSTAKAGVSGNGVVTEVYVDTDATNTIGNTTYDVDKITVVQINTYLVQASDDYSTKNEELKVSAISDISLDSTTIDNDDVDVSSFKEDDYILVTGVMDNNRLTIKTAEKASLLSGKVTDYVEKDSVKIDGTKYSYSEKVDAASKASSYSVGDETSVVLDKYGYIISVDEVVVNTNNYVFVREFYANNGVASTKSAVKADLYFTDGKNVDDAKIEKVNGSTAKSANIGSYATGWYTFSESNGEYTLRLPASKYVANGAADQTPVDYTSDGKIIVGDKVKFMDPQPYKASDDTVMMVLDDDGDITVYTGADKLPDVTISNASADHKATVTVLKKNGGNFVDFVFVDLYDVDSNVNNATKNSTDYVFVLNKNGKDAVNANKDSYYIFKAVKDGEVIDFNADSVSLFTANTVYNNIKTNSDGIATGRDVVTAGSDTLVNTLSGVTATSNGNTIDMGSLSGRITKDTKVTLVLYKSSGLNKDSNADYVVTSPATAKALVNELDGKSVTGGYVAVYADDIADTDDIATLFVYITAAN